MTNPSNEFDSQSAMPDFKLIQVDPNLLLRPDVLHTVLRDPAQLVPSDDPGGKDSPTAETQQSALFAQETVLSSIIRPEKAARLATESKGRMDEFLLEDLEIFGQSLAAAQTAGEEIDSAVRRIASADQTADASQNISRINEVLHNFRSLDDLHTADWRSPLAMLEDYAHRYTDGMVGVSGRQDDATTAVRGVVNASEQAADNYVRPARNLYDQVHDERTYGSFDDDTVNAVISRGKPTIAAHQQECTDEANATIGQAEQTAGQVSRLSDDALELFAYLRVVGETTEGGLPYRNLLLDQVGNIKYAISMMEAGSFDTASYALQRVEEAASTISRIRNGAEQVDSAVGRFTTTIDSLRQTAQGITQSQSASGS